jgi:hypothetical protein
MTGMRRIGDLFRMPVLFAAALLLLLPGEPFAADTTPAAPGGGEPGRTAEAPEPAGEIAYAERLVEAARRLRLSEERYWHTLLHYKRGLAGLRSLVDDPKFFLSPRGKRDPEAELEASLRAFFEPPGGAGKHPLCRFVGRYAWLKERLDLDPARLPLRECEPFSRLVAEMQPVSMTLVFPAAHMNSPASMFGHTLLIYETAPGSRLLAHAVSYSAITRETFAPLFALKGIVGAYPGHFSVLPYYAKLQEYADIDRRDLWEYPLNFTREETIRSLMHAYELEAIASDYYFFDENCSYVLLFLLDAGRPALDLTDRTAPWVIPLDTIRLVEAAGLVAGAGYRPSQTARIRHIGSLLDRPTRLLAVEVAEGRAAPERLLALEPSREARGRALDLAVEYLQYRYARQELTREVYTERLLRLLAARSALGVSAGERYEIPPPPRPEEGHASNRLRLGAGLEKGEGYQEVRFRFAYHTLADDDRGYLEGSHIAFGETALRYYVEAQAVKLERFDLLDIVSLSPRDELFQPVSWKIRVGATRRVMADGVRHLAFQFSPGGGLAARIPYLGLGYAMLETEASLGEKLEEKHAVGLGGSLGLLRSLTDRWKLLLAVRGLYFGLGDRHGLLEVTLTQNVRLTRDLAVSLDVSRSRTREFYRTDATLALNVFF